jgi:GH24 family phage-related lysozyme (muramidase)
MFNKQKFIEHLINIEGNIPWMYLDSVGKVTVGIGHYIPDLKDVLKLRFILRQSGEPASDTQIKNEYLLVKSKLGPYQSKGANYYKPFTVLILPKDQIIKLAEEDIRKFQEQIIKKFPDFESYPDTVDLAIMDIIYQHGLSGGFDNAQLTAAIKSRDWLKAANSLDNLRSTRNLQRRAWFLRSNLGDFNPRRFA